MTVETFLGYVPPAIAIGTTLMAVVVAAMLVYVVWRWSLLKAQSAKLGTGVHPIQLIAVDGDDTDIDCADTDD